jgi:hypothetical protein
MGAAIECFDRAGALLVPRGRFAPVKTTSDLLVLRSDAYRATEDHRLVLVPERAGRPPVVDLDPRGYRFLADFERAFAEGVPSLARCESLRVTGPCHFSAGVVCVGAVELINASPAPRRVAAGTYADGRTEL